MCRYYVDQNYVTSNPLASGVFSGLLPGRISK